MNTVYQLHIQDLILVQALKDVDVGGVYPPQKILNFLSIWVHENLDAFSCAVETNCISHT